MDGNQTCRLVPSNHPSKSYQTGALALEARPGQQTNPRVSLPANKKQHDFAAAASSSIGTLSTRVDGTPDQDRSQAVAGSRHSQQKLAYPTPDSSRANTPGASAQSHVALASSPSPAPKLSALAKKTDDSPASTQESAADESKDVEVAALTAATEDLLVDATRELGIAEAENSGTAASEKLQNARKQLREVQELADSLGAVSLEPDAGTGKINIPFAAMGIRLGNFTRILEDEISEHVLNVEETDSQLAQVSNEPLDQATMAANIYKEIGDRLQTEKGGWEKYRELTDAYGLSPTLEQQQYAVDSVRFLAKRSRPIEMLLQDNCGGRRMRQMSRHLRHLR
ncbi:hypothetical protein HDU86_006051 [Geranomyces michiganensis]|nr:hypothetical protein HDU86_006051 [Geranomyces michiganensis]